jgi:hypothetical protein
MVLLFYQRLSQDSFSPHSCKESFGFFPAYSSGLNLAKILQKNGLTFVPAAIPGLILTTLRQKKGLIGLFLAASPGLILITLLQKNGLIGFFSQRLSQDSFSPHSCKRMHLLAFFQRLALGSILPHFCKRMVIGLSFLPAASPGLLLDTPAKELFHWFVFTCR